MQMILPGRAIGGSSRTSSTERALAVLGPHLVQQAAAQDGVQRAVVRASVREGLAPDVVDAPVGAGDPRADRRRRRSSRAASEKDPTPPLPRTVIEMAKDLPTGRVRRAAKVGRLAGGQTARSYATKAANLARSRGRPPRAPPSVARSRPRTRSSRCSGQMKGAAMKVGQVASFIDTGAFPPEFQEHIQAKLAELRDSAPRVPFEKMREVVERRPRRAARRVLRRVRRRGRGRRLDRPGLPRPAARRARDVAVKVQYPGRGPGGARRPPEPGTDHARGQAGGARNGREGDDEGDQGAPHRRARLRARGPEPPRLRPHLERASLHLRARRWSPA